MIYPHHFPRIGIHDGGGETALQSQGEKGAVDGISVSEPAKSDAKTVVVTIRFTSSIIDENGEHIDKVITVLDRMYEAMLVSARRKS
jgi:hypothetical protein